MKNETYIGIGLGNLIAAILSWSVNQSVLLGLVHALLGWFYVIYWIIYYKLII